MSLLLFLPWSAVCINIWFRSVPRKVMIYFVATVKYGSICIRKRHFKFGKDEKKKNDDFPFLGKTYLFRGDRLFVFCLVLAALLLW